MKKPTKSYILQHSPKRQALINIVGTIAAILSSVSLMPQLYAVRSYRDIGGLSLGTPLIIVCTSTLWLTYHLLTGTYHGAFSGSFNLMSSILISWTIISIRYLGAPGID